MSGIRVPGDKSITHRALILAALASGRSRIRRPLVAADTQATASALRQLGCGLPLLEAGAELVIDGVGLTGLRASDAPVDCANSGTTARLLMGVLAGQQFDATLTGDASLRSRPMRRVTRPLTDMGATFEELDQPDRLPVRVRGGRLRSIRYDSPHASAQVKSAILLAGLTGGVAVEVTEPIPSRDHTERLLHRLGLPVGRVHQEDGSATVSLSPIHALPPLDLDVPGDFSSAAFVIALGCLAARDEVRVVDVGLNPTRTGALGVLRRMGAELRIENERDSGGEPVGDVVVRRVPLRGVHVRASEIPSMVDEIPILAVVAACAEGATTIEGAEELRVKESDRIAALVTNLRILGVRADELPDGLVVHGGDRPLAGRVRALHDHRIAMAFGLLSAVAGSRVEIDDPGIVAVSYPEYWTMLEQVTAP